MNRQAMKITALITIASLVWLSCGSGGGGSSTSALNPDATFGQEPWVNTTWKLARIGTHDVSSRGFSVSFRRNSATARVDFSGALAVTYWEPFQMLFNYRNNSGDSCVSTLNNMYISANDRDARVSGFSASITTMNNRLAGYTCSCGPGYFQAATATGREWDDQAKFELQKEVSATKLLIQAQLSGDYSTLVAYIILMAMAGSPVSGQYIAENPVLEFQLQTN